MRHIVDRTLIGLLALSLVSWASAATSGVTMPERQAADGSALAIAPLLGERVVSADRPRIVPQTKGVRIALVKAASAAGLVAQRPTAGTRLSLSPVVPVSPMALHVAGRAPPLPSET